MLYETMNIVLIGYRATGKTTVSKLLAEQTGLKRVSSDEEVEKRLGCTIAEYVEGNGWPGFRRLEAEVVNELAAADGQVIDAGGGVVEDKENVRRLRACGVLVWLRTSIPEIIRRLEGDTTRPALSSGKDARQEVTEVLERRLPLYAAAAHVEIDTAAMTPKEVAERAWEITRNKLG